MPTFRSVFAQTLIFCFKNARFALVAMLCPLVVVFVIDVADKYLAASFSIDVPPSFWQESDFRGQLFSALRLGLGSYVFAVAFSCWGMYLISRLWPTGAPAIVLSSCRHAVFPLFLAMLALNLVTAIFYWVAGTMIDVTFGQSLNPWAFFALALTQLGIAMFVWSQMALMVPLVLGGYARYGILTTWAVTRQHRLSLFLFTVLAMSIGAAIGFLVYAVVPIAIIFLGLDESDTSGIVDAIRNGALWAPYVVIVEMLFVAFGFHYLKHRAMA